MNTTPALERKPIANRMVYGKTLVELGEQNPDIVVLDADISKSTQTIQFAKRFPERFFNMGAAEQNMICTAAGLATAGKLPFASTFAMFAGLRASEQVRTSVAYPRLNVKIVATNAGVEIAGDGVSHQAAEDLAVMRAIANMVVMSPSDPASTRKAILAIAEYDGPVYMRLGRQDAEWVHAEDVDFTIGKMIRIREGTDLTIIATGHMVAQALRAAEELASRGIETRVLDCHTIKPIDNEAIIAAARDTGGIITAEDHSILGGLGGAVCEVVAAEHPTLVHRVGVQDRFCSSGRDHRKLLAHYHLDAAEIVRQAERLVRGGERWRDGFR
jgi:transketolase